MLGSFANQHITHIADIWALIYKWEDFIGATRERLDVASAAWPDSMVQATLAESQSQALDIRKGVETARFWLGQELYRRFIEYHNHLEPYISALLDRNFAKVHYLQRSLDRDKEDIMSLLKIGSDSFYRL